MTYYVSSGTLNLTKPKHWDGGLTFPIPLPLCVPVTVMRDMQKNIRIELATLLLYHRKKNFGKSYRYRNG